MYMIFSFSGQAGDTSSDLSFRVSRKIVSIGNEVLGTNLAEDRIDHYAERINGFVRKLAHVTEYFALAVAVAFPLYVYGLRGMLLMLLAGAFCVAFACGDEFHQSFVSGRTPSKRDVCIDSIGIFFGILVVRMVGWTGRMTIFRSKSPEPEQPQPNPYYRPVPPRNPDSYPGGVQTYAPPRQQSPNNPAHWQGPGNPSPQRQERPPYPQGSDPCAGYRRPYVANFDPEASNRRYDYEEDGEYEDEEEPISGKPLRLFHYDDEYEEEEVEEEEKKPSPKSRPFFFQKHKR